MKETSEIKKYKAIDFFCGERDRLHRTRQETSHTSILQHQGGVNLQQRSAAIGEICQSARGLEMPADYV